MISRNFHFVIFIFIALVGLSVLAMALVDRYLPDEEPAPTVDRLDELHLGGEHGNFVLMSPSEMRVKPTGNMGIGITAPLYPLVIQGRTGEILRAEDSGDIYLRGEKIGHDNYIVRDLRAAYSQVTLPSCTGRDEKTRWRDLQQMIDPTRKRVRIDPETGNVGIGSFPKEDERKD